jgi:hypothetical protein
MMSNDSEAIDCDAELDCKRIQLLKNLDEKIDELGKEANRHKNLYRGLRYSLFSLSGVSAVLAGVAVQSSDHSNQINLLILVLSSVAGLITSIEGVRKPAELWILERTTYNALLDLKREVEYQFCQANGVDVDLYFKQMQAILSGAGNQWNQHATPQQAQILAQPVNQDDTQTN